MYSSLASSRQNYPYIMPKVGIQIRIKFRVVCTSLALRIIRLRRMHRIQDDPEIIRPSAMWKLDELRLLAASVSNEAAPGS